MVGRGCGDVERAARGAGQGAVARRQRVTCPDLVDEQAAEGRHAADGCDRSRAA